MSFDLKNRWAVVTGASSGIGRALATALARRGCHLAIVARREDRLKALAAELHKTFGVDAVPLAFDLSEPEAAQKLVEALAPHPVSIVVNNAGAAVVGPFQKQDWQAYRRMLDLNVAFLTHFTQLMIPVLAKCGEGARILNVGSITGYQGVPYMASYAATKAYINNLSEGLNWELRGTGIRVTCLEPGQTASEFFEAAGRPDARMANKGLMTPSAVARQGIDAMVKGKSKVVAGWFNKIRIFALRFSPRFSVRMVITRLFRDLA